MRISAPSPLAVGGGGSTHRRKSVRHLLNYFIKELTTMTPTIRGRRARHDWRSSRAARGSARRREASLAFEALEDRALLSVVFNYNPQFGAETQTQDDGAALQSPPVYLIFWGPYWGSADGADANRIKRAAINVLSTPYLSGLTQYHSDGLVSLDPENSAYDSRDPSSLNFDASNIDDIVQNQIDNGPLPEPDTPAHTPIYVVVTPPNIYSSDGTQVGGFNFLGHDNDVGFLYDDIDDIPEVWCSTGDNPDGTVNVDQFSQYFSHEVAEIMSDLGGGGFKVNPGPGWPFSQEGLPQIGDFEGANYSWRQPNGTVVQPYWSARDNNWLVPDGNSQVLYLNPIWNGLSYTGQSTLNIYGDQWGANYDDTIVIDTVANGLQVTLNVEVTSFDANTITAINVYTRGGVNTVNVRNVPPQVNVNIQGGGSDTVNVGSGGSVQGIQGTIKIEDPPAHTTINIDDSADLFARTTVLGTWTPSGDSEWGYITGLAPASINYEYADTSSLSINTGRASGNVIGVREDGVTTNLVSHGAATVNVGDANGVRGLLGTLSISNPPNHTTLNVDDSADPLGRTATVTDSSITGIAPAVINYTGSDVNHLNIDTGTGSNTIDVRGTSYDTATSIISHGAATVNVGDANGVQGLLGTLSISNPPNHTTLNVDDSADPLGRTVTVGSGSITGLAPANILYAGSGLKSLTIDGSDSGDSHFTVTDTPTNGLDPSNPNSLTTTLNPSDFFGGCTVNVQGTSDPLIIERRLSQDTITIGNATDGLASINADVSVQDVGSASGPPNAADRLIVDDSADPVATRAATISAGRIAGLAPKANINYQQGYLVSLTIDGGAHGNNFTIFNTPDNGLPPTDPNFLTTTLTDGSSTNTVTVLGTTGGLAINAQGGNDTITLGDPSTNLDGISPNRLSVNGGTGRTTLLVDDKANQNIDSAEFPSLGDIVHFTEPIFTVTNSTVSRHNPVVESARGHITKSYASDLLVSYRHLAGITVIGGDLQGKTASGTSHAGNTFDVTSTLPGTPVTIEAGSGQDLVQLGDLNNSLDDIATLDVQGGGSTQLVLDDKANQNIDTPQFPPLGDVAHFTEPIFTVTNSTVSRHNPVVESARGHITKSYATDLLVSYRRLAGITVIGGDLQGKTASGTSHAGNTFTIQSVPALRLSIQGGAGNDTFQIRSQPAAVATVSLKGGGTNTLVGPNANETWTIAGLNAGSVGGVSCSNVQNLIGGTGNDTFGFNTGAWVSGAITGGGGTNTLAYSAYAGNILVDLLSGTATAVGGGIALIQQVIGSNGDDLIVGDAQPSQLTGGTGRNVLIGGAGLATLDATRGHGDNILIGGTTNWDRNLAALDAIQAEWDRTDLGFDDRRSDLMNGRNKQGKTPLNMAKGQLILLTPSTNRGNTNGTVHANAFADTLIGSNETGPGTGKRVHNWFLYALDDVIESYLSSSDREQSMA
jgi:hypothetical protein